MRFLADMGIARSVDRLRAEGFDSLHLLEQGLERLNDPAIVEKARDENRIILTHDLDVGDLLAVGGFHKPSVITFRLVDMKAAVVIDHLFAALPLFATGLEAGACVTISNRKARCRLLPLASSNR